MTINNNFISRAKTQESKARIVMPDGARSERTINLIKEHMIEIYVNEKAAFRLACTADMLPELVLGRLVTEGFVKGLKDVESIYICENGNRARVYLNPDLKPEALRDAVPEELTCCTDNKAVGGLKPLYKLEPMARAEYTPDEVFALAEKFSENASLHKSTSGTHSCYLSCKGSYQGVFEDIGRHNAIDKAVGYALINGLSLCECMLFTTGRVPMDMARKAIMAGVPVLASKAVPTAEAVEMARRFGLTLICRAWRDSYEIYA